MNFNTKKRIFYWALYDFANAIAMIVFFLYFTEWLVVERHVSDLTYNMIFVGASILLLLTAPLLSLVADKWRNRLVFLRPATICSFLCYMTCGIIANFFPYMTVLAVVFYLIGNYFYQLIYTFYNPILPDVSTPETRGTISGIGMTASWLGQICGLLIAFPIAALPHPIFGIGIAGRTQTFFPAAIIFIVLSMPMLIFFKENEKPTYAKISLKKEIINFGSSVKRLWIVPGMALFLGSYFFFNDAIVTAANNFPIYLQKVFGVPDNIKSYALLGVLVTSAIGAYISGRIADKVGLKKSLRYILLGWIVIMPILALQTKFNHFAVAIVFMGFLYGAVSTVARAVMTQLTPISELNFAFSFYSLMERCSTFVGPVGWGLSLYALSGFGKNAYRLSFLTLTIFVIVGYICVSRIQNKHLPKEGTAHL